MLRTNQEVQVHEFDVCARVYFEAVDYSKNYGELEVGTFFSTSWQKAEETFQARIISQSKKLGRKVECVDIIFTHDVTAEANGSGMLGDTHV